MRVRLLQIVLAALLSTGAVLVATSAASANPWAGVDCEQFPDHADCQTGVGAPGQPSWEAPPAGDVVCHNNVGEVVDCYIEGSGWIGADGCRYFANPSDGNDQPEGETRPGAWYVRQCTGGEASVVWIPDAEAPGPALLAQLAVSRLVLPPPQLELSPPAPAPQLVMLPTWLWVAPQWWSPRSASASVPGITVTAVATPVEARWTTGDGGEHRCAAGTPYTADADPAAASPTCGHTYTRTSADQPGGVFQLAVTVTWQVSWSGGGASGTVDPLFSTATVPVEVVESLSRNTRSLP